MITIGHIDFINMIPFDLEGPPEQPYKKIKGPPTQINRMLLQGEVDLGVISLAFFLEHKDRLQRLGNYGIISDGPVLSVMLFSVLDLAKGGEKGSLKVFETPKSATSIILNRLILRQVYQTEVLPVPTAAEAQAVLLIGNDALLERAKNRWEFSYDLGEQWKKKTGLPMVFAVLATKTAAFRKKEKEINNFLKYFSTNYQKSIRNIDTIVMKARQKVPLNEEVLYRYFRCLHYEMGVKEEQSLALFEEMMGEYYTGKV